MKHWNVIITKPKAERKVAERLERLGITSYCPVRKERRQWSDRVKTVVVPLLPSMVLVQIEDKVRHGVFDIPGVLKYLYYLGEAAKVRAEEVAVLKDIEANGSAVLEIKSIAPGDVVELPYLGSLPQKGIVKQVSGDRCWVVLQELGYVVVVRC